MFQYLDYLHGLIGKGYSVFLIGMNNLLLLQILMGPVLTTRTTACSARIRETTTTTTTTTTPFPKTSVEAQKSAIRLGVNLMHSSHYEGTRYALLRAGEGKCSASTRSSLTLIWNLWMHMGGLSLQVYERPKHVADGCCARAGWSGLPPGSSWTTILLLVLMGFAA